MKTFNFCIACIGRIAFIAFIGFIAFILCIPFISPAQVSDNFSDGDFTNNPPWIGDTAHFEINSSRQLHLTTTGSDTSVLFTRNTRMMNTEWHFWMKLSFNTSANNYSRIYLTADTSGQLSIVNGIFLQAGGGDDSVLIMKQTGMTIKTVFRFKSYKTFHSTNTLRFKIIHGDAGIWEALIDTTGGYNFISEGTFFENTFTATRWFGLMCRYTSSNATKFYFDDLYVGPVYHDTIPPRIAETETLSARMLQVSFSEPIQKQSAENLENYQFTPRTIRVDSVFQDIRHPETVSVLLHDSLAQGSTVSLQIRNIPDLQGNFMRDTIVPVCYYLPQAYDILINEIMADPDPPVELPNGEFVEMYNRSAFPVNLKNWTFRYGSYSKIFSSMNIPAGGYLLVVKDSAFLNFARCAVLFTSSTSLSNEGTTLVLKDPHGHVIHSVAYSPDWYRRSFKGEGGWSLEMTDPSNPCGCMENWEPSFDASGGTPGRVNSVRKTNPDETAPVPLRAVILDSARIKVTFSEAMDSLSLVSPADWTIDPPGTHPAAVMPVSPDFSSAELLSNEAFTRGVSYSLRVSGKLRDCAANDCDTSRSIRFALPDSVTGHDVVINEILSNPASGGSRFVELYNRSEKIIDLQTLVLANRDTSEGVLENATPLTPAGYLLFPGDYVAMTSGPADICERYHPAIPENIAGMSGFPVFGDDTGTVILARKDNLKIIDRMKYSSGMHYPLLATTEGVSLERTNPDFPSEDKNNWHSAAETAGFATPGYRNSHWMVPDETDREILVQPAIFSPDNDGRDDLLTITIRTNDPDCAVNIEIFNSRGREVRQLVNNVLSGSESVFIWDGMTEMRTKAPTGIYVLLIELVRPDGVMRKVKRTVILGGKL